MNDPNEPLDKSTRDMIDKALKQLAALAKALAQEGDHENALECWRTCIQILGDAGYPESPF